MAEKKLDTVVDTLGEARERLSDAARGAGERYQKVAEEMRREAEREKVSTAVTGIREGYGKVSKNVGSFTEDVADYVRDNPGRSLLMAAGVGFLLGLLFRRSTDD